jgi:DNA repair exonuclease SbcCD ATPase subunit
MQPVKCLGLVCAGCLGMLALASSSHSIYFTMQLKNGSELITDYYSIDNSSMIRFYTNEGAVAIPKSIIKNIKSNDGIVTVELEESDQNRQPAAGGENEDGQKSPTGSVSEKEAAQERLSSITDQLAVINANLDNLSKNKNIFIAQKEQYAQQKRTIEERIERIKKEGVGDAPSKERERNIELEQTKLKDADAKFQDMQQRIENNQKMFDAQQRIKQRFEEDLAKLKK